MNNKTVLTDEEIINIGYQSHSIEQGIGVYLLPITFARAIEKAILQSDKMQELRKDAERIKWLEEQTKKSYTGISFDYHRHIEDGYVVDHGYRFIRRHFASGYMNSLRKAIDSDMEKNND